MKLRIWLTCELELSANLANALALERSIRSKKNGSASLKGVKSILSSYILHKHIKTEDIHLDKYFTKMAI